MLQVHKVSKIINAKPVLTDISLSVPPGNIAFLLGGPGSGKSTFLRILNNLEQPDTGKITLDDKVLNATNTHKLISLVFQHFNLFPHLTAQQNITLALEQVYHKNPKEAAKTAQNLLKQYKLEHKATASVNDLSGGQKQRLAIARALAIKPYVICFDEPTSALDPLLTSHIAQQIQQLANESCIVIVATHDMNLVFNDNIKGTLYVMKDGRIIEHASTEQLKMDEKKLKYLKNFIKGGVETEQEVLV